MHNSYSVHSFIHSIRRRWHQKQNEFVRNWHRRTRADQQAYIQQCSETYLESLFHTVMSRLFALRNLPPPSNQQLLEYLRLCVPEVMKPASSIDVIGLLKQHAGGDLRWEDRMDSLQAYLFCSA